MWRWLRTVQAVCLLIAGLWLLLRLEMLVRVMLSVEREVQHAVRYLDKIKPFLDQLP